MKLPIFQNVHSHVPFPVSKLVRRARGYGAVVVLAAIGLIAPEVSASDRIDRIESLLENVRAELDSLKRESAQGSLRYDTISRTPILAELLSDRQRALAKANQTPQRTLAAGYTFNLDLPIGMHAVWWSDPWGVKVEGGAIITEKTHIAGIGATGLYSIHRFNALDILDTHLYALAGTGFYWERVLWWENVAEPWYETPDRWVRGQIGVGTEFTLYNFGGVRFVPETGLQGDRYLSRYENSPSHVSDAPKSDFSLSPFFAFHISFYFR